MIIRKVDDAHRTTTKSGNEIHWMVEKSDGADVFEMRVISIPPSGKSSSGKHQHEHEVFILGGHGRVISDCEEHVLEPGMSVYVKRNEYHQWQNDSDFESFRFICIIESGAEDFVK